MLDFRQNTARQRNQGRQKRRGLLVLVLLLGIAGIIIDRARDPVLWQRLGLLLSAPIGTSGTDSIDNRLAAGRSSDPREIAVEGAGRLTDQPQLREQLAAVRDDAPSTRDEQACSLQLLNTLNQTDGETLKKGSLGPVTYAQLFRQPSQFRGRLVTVSGVIHRVNPIELSPNEYGITAYYQTWLSPSDSPSSPIVVYCLRLPEGFPTGMELAEQAELTGFFFKRWAYQAQDAVRTAPVLLAQTLQWQRRPTMAPVQPPGIWMIPLMVCTATALALLAAGYLYFRTRPARPTLPDRLPDLNLELPTVSDRQSTINNPR